MKTGYRKPALLVLMVVMALAWGPALAADWYVNPGASPGGDGTSWSKAFQTIQQALNAASSIWTICMAPPDTIHVRDGVYPRVTPFTINKYVRILGGYNFKGVRDWKRFPSIIDGLNETRCLNITAPAILDGFIIRNGSSNLGAGMYIDSTPVYCSINDFYHVPTIKNCIIENNTATEGGGLGGGIYDVESDTEIENCRFIGNIANVGGAIHHSYTSITINKCVFQGNQSVSSGWCGGGAIYGLHHNTDTGGLVFIKNSLFHENSSDSNGGAICNNEVDPQIWNSTFYGNTAAAGYSGGAYFGFPLSDGPYVYNSIFWANTPDQLQIDNPRYYVGYSNVQGGWTGLGDDNIDADPSFVDPATGDFHLSMGSPCIDTGRYFGTALPDDLDGVLRPHDGNGDGTAEWDMGAYEYTYTTLLGDFDWDWDVDGHDLRGFGRGFGFRLGESGYNASLDFDANGRVDTNDLAIFSDAYGQMEVP